MADQLFSPALLLAEAIETHAININPGCTVVELGAGTALPSLLMATRRQPSLVVLTDYPDPFLLESLKRNIECNRSSFWKGATVQAVGYEWGTDAQHLRCDKAIKQASPSLTSISEPLPAGRTGFDVVIMSDLLHFGSSHDELMMSALQLLGESADARLYVAAGKYTKPEVQNDPSKAKQLTHDVPMLR